MEDTRIERGLFFSAMMLLKKKDIKNIECVSRGLPVGGIVSGK